MKLFLKGIKIYFQGQIFAWTRLETRKIIFLTFLLNIILFFLTFGILSFKMVEFLKIKVPAPQVWYDYLLKVGAYGLGAFLVILASGIVVYALASLILVGVGDSLSKKVLRIKNVIPSQGGSFNFKKWLMMLVKVAALITASFLAFIISLFPGLGFVGIYMAALLMAFDMMDYGFDHLHLTLKERLSFFKSNIKIIAGFTLALMVFLLIPGFNILMLPGGVVAATFLLAEIKRAS